MGINITIKIKKKKFTSAADHSPLPNESIKDLRIYFPFICPYLFLFDEVILIYVIGFYLEKRLKF